MDDEYAEGIRRLGGDPTDRTPDAEWQRLEEKAAKKWDRMTPAERLATRVEIAAKRKKLTRESEYREAYVDGYCVEHWGDGYRAAVEADRVEAARIEAERVKVAAKDARKLAKLKAASPKAATRPATRPATATDEAATGADTRKRSQRRPRPRQFTMLPDGRLVNPIFDDDDYD